MLKGGLSIKKYTFAGSNFDYGYYAWAEDDVLVIGEERGREGGILYRGKFLGENTPWIRNIKKENKKLYDSIAEYFHSDDQAWKRKFIQLIASGCSDSHIEDFEREHGLERGSAFKFKDVYETRGTPCEGCKHIAFRYSMYPCNCCMRHMKDMYES